MKLTVIIWNTLSLFITLVVMGAPYIKPEGYLFLEKKLGLIKRIKKEIDKFVRTN